MRSLVASACWVIMGSAVRFLHDQRSPPIQYIKGEWSTVCSKHSSKRNRIIHSAYPRTFPEDSVWHEGIAAVYAEGMRNAGLSGVGFMPAESPYRAGLRNATAFMNIRMSHTSF